ncbi:hypothetical protein [Actinophytocola sp.]|uniref:hypothetical protein n=1 Tax=Actinophytocola sp. TaxID=1872138 RepID=UPI002ED2A9A2
MITNESRAYDEAALKRRAERAEQAVADLSEQHTALAGEVVAAYRARVEDLGWDVFEAARRTVAEFGGRSLRRPEVEQHAPITHADLDAADGQVKPLLVRVVAAERAREELVKRPEVTVHDVIGLFEEYQRRHNYEPDHAASAAVTEVSEGCAAYVETFLGELELREGSR